MMPLSPQNLDEKKQLLIRHNKGISLMTFKKMQKQPPKKFSKKLFIKSFAIFSGNTCVGARLKSVLNSEHCEIFYSTYFEEHLRTAASENSRETDKN